MRIDLSYSLLRKAQQLVGPVFCLLFVVAAGYAALTTDGPIPTGTWVIAGVLLLCAVGLILTGPNFLKKRTLLLTSEGLELVDQHPLRADWHQVEHVRVAAIHRASRRGGSRPAALALLIQPRDDEALDAIEGAAHHRDPGDDSRLRIPLGPRPYLIDSLDHDLQLGAPSTRYREVLAELPGAHPWRRSTPKE